MALLRFLINTAAAAAFGLCLQVPKPCPKCKTDIADFLAHPTVNTEMADLIKKLQDAAEKAQQEAEQEENGLKDGSADDGNDGDADDEADHEEEEENDQGEDVKEQQQEENGGEDKDITDQAPKKKQKLAAAAAAVATGGDGKQEAAEEAAAAAKPSTAAAAAPVAAAVRYAAELAQLRESFPEFDGELVLGMLEDQGGDMLEVHAQLKVRYMLLVQLILVKVYIK